MRKRALMVASAGALVLVVAVGSTAQDRPASDYSHKKSADGCSVHATNLRDRETMFELCEALLPSDAFERIKVDSSDVVLVVSDAASRVLNNHRILTYFAMVSFAELWGKWSGYKDVTVSLQVNVRTDSRIDNIRFARGKPTPAGYSVNMARLR